MSWVHYLRNLFIKVTHLISDDVYVLKTRYYVIGIAHNNVSIEGENNMSRSFTKYW